MTYLALQSHAMDLVAQLEAVGCGARPRYRRWTPQGHQAAAQTLRRCIAPRQMCMHLGALIGTGCHLQPVNLQGKRTRTPHWPSWEKIYPHPTTSATRRRYGQTTLCSIFFFFFDAYTCTLVENHGVCCASDCREYKLIRPFLFCPFGSTSVRHHEESEDEFWDCA